jgi:hypothetical protein
MSRTCLNALDYNASKVLYIILSKRSSRVSIELEFNLEVLGQARHGALPLVRVAYVEPNLEAVGRTALDDTKAAPAKVEKRQKGVEGQSKTAWSLVKLQA